MNYLYNEKFIITFPLPVRYTFLPADGVSIDLLIHFVNSANRDIPVVAVFLGVGMLS